MLVLDDQGGGTPHLITNISIFYYFFLPLIKIRVYDVWTLGHGGSHFQHTPSFASPTNNPSLSPNLFFYLNYLF